MLHSEVLGIKTSECFLRSYNSTSNKIHLLQNLVLFSLFPLIWTCCMSEKYPSNSSESYFQKLYLQKLQKPIYILTIHEVQARKVLGRLPTSFWKHPIPDKSFPPSAVYCENVSILSLSNQLLKTKQKETTAKGYKKHSWKDRMNT